MPRAWIRSAAALAAAWSGGCSNPFVSVTFETPAPYRSEVASVRLEIIEPPVGSPFDCDDVAFGVVTDEALSLSTTSEATLSASGEEGELAGISRKGTKLFLGRGLDSSGRMVVADCAEHGELSGEVTVDLRGQPASIVELADTAFTEELPAEIDVTVTDVLGAPLAADARWLVVGPRGDRTSGEAKAGGDGRAVLQPRATPLGGPALLEVQVRWQRGTPKGTSYFQDVAGVTLDVDPPDGLVPMSAENLIAQRSAFRVGRFGADGQTAVAALSEIDPATLGQRIVVHGFDLAGEGAATTVAADLSSPLLALEALPGADRDRVVGLSATGWTEMRVEAAGVVPIVTAPNPSGQIATQLVHLGPCDGSRAMLVASLADGSRATFDPSSGFAMGPDPFPGLPSEARLVDSGCASTAEGTVHRVVVFEPAPCNEALEPECPPEPATLLMTDAAGGGLSGIVPYSSAAVGFAPATGGRGPKVVATVFDLDGAGIASFDLVIDGGLDLSPVDRVSTIVPGDLTFGGDFDGDGGLDLGAMLVFDREPDGNDVYRFFLSLAVEHRGRRLSAVAQEQRGFRPHVRPTDLDGDGVHDLIIGAPTLVGIALMGVPRDER